MVNLQERTQCFIDGKWADSSNNSTFEVRNPANNSLISQVPDCDRHDAIKAIEAADEAFFSWSATPAKERSKKLKQWQRLILANEATLAKIMTLESGKPIYESESEVRYAAAYIEWFAEEAIRVRGDIIPQPSNDRRLFAQKQPIGVCAAITPWNYPLATLARKCAPALAAGCTIVLKPAEATPLSALALAKLAEEAGFPSGTLNVITSEQGKEIGNILSTHPLVKKISFTGSTKVGKSLLKNAADTVKKTTLELGGNAPFIVFDDADLEKAVQSAMASKFRNTGQTCACANRFLVQENIANDFAIRLAEETKSLVIGDGSDRSTNQGPLINKAALNKIERLVKDAIDKGACVLTGGTPHKLGGLFYQPTVLTNTNASMQLSQEEIFGPVAAIQTFSSEADAIHLANDTPFGLSAYVFTENLSRIFRVTEQLQYGMVGVNEGILSSELAPFGGVKESGLGREGSHFGIEEYLEIKYLCLGGLE